MSFYYNCMQTHIGTGMLNEEKKPKKTDDEKHWL